MIRLGSLTGERRNLIFAAVLIASILLTSVTAWRGMVQNQKLAVEHARFNQAVSAIESGDYATAEPLLAEVIKTNQDSWLVAYYYGLVLEESNHPHEADVYLENAAEIRPALLRNQGFLLLFGRNLKKLGQPDRANVYLKKCIAINTNPALTQTAEQMLKGK
ncbi:MAG: tetratricopeptide repeat protein [Solirubrobacterales bacterium]